MNIEAIKRDIEILGLPKLHDYSFGFDYDIQVNDYMIVDSNTIKFIVNDNGCFNLSFLDADLVEIRSPDNLIIECKKCYRIIQRKNERDLGFIYWRNKKELHSDK